MKVLFNGNIETMVSGAGSAEAIAFDAGRIVAVGSRAQVDAVAGANAQRTDLDGRTVLPGLIDAHHHFSGGVLRPAAIEVGPGRVSDMEGLVTRLREGALLRMRDAWVVAHGYDELALAERRHPLRADLDRACPDRPLLLGHYSWHEGVVNSRALELLGMHKGMPDPPAGVIERGRDGEPTGRVVETAFSMAVAAADDGHADRPGDFVRYLRQYEDELFAQGITRVCDPAVSPSLEALYRQVHASGALRMPIVMLPVSPSGHLCPPWDRLDGSVTGEGPETLRVGPLKIFLDGATRCSMCLTIPQLIVSIVKSIAAQVRTRSFSSATLSSTKDMGLRLGPGLKLHMGVQYFGDDELHRLVRAACDRGFSIAIHALGNGAVDQAVRAIETIRSIHNDVPAPRIEHATIMDHEAVARAAGIGATLVTQPQFLELPIFDAMPAPPGMWFLGHRAMLDAGVHLAGGSDAPVTTYEPFVAMRSAVHRRSGKGQIIQGDQAIEPSEVLAMFTREAARALGALDVTGTLEVGKRADLIVLSERPGADNLERVRVQQTVLAGETVYDAATPGAARAPGVTPRSLPRAERPGVSHQRTLR